LDQKEQMKAGPEFAPMGLAQPAHMGDLLSNPMGHPTDGR
jgi:hypothetical protein